MQNFKTLASLGSRAGRAESYLKTGFLIMRFKCKLYIKWTTTYGNDPKFSDSLFMSTLFAIP